VAIFIGRRPEAGFTRIPNAWARDPKLTTKAKGLLTYLLSHQDGYQLSLKQVIAENADGRDAIYKALAELAEHGYIRRDQRRKPGGMVGEVDYHVTDAPVTTASGFTASGESGSGDDQGKRDETAGGTASWNTGSGSAVSGKADTKKTRVKKTKVLEDQNTISLSVVSEASARPTIPAPRVEREMPDEDSPTPEPRTLPHRLLLKNGAPEESLDFLEGFITSGNNVLGNGWWVTADRNGTLPDHITEGLKALDEQTAGGKPPWCGNCDERTRERTTGWMENISVSCCPDCHPLVVQPRTEQRDVTLRRSAGAQAAEQALRVAAELDGYSLINRSGHQPYRNPPIEAYYGDL
jgi:hypothetical protein